MRVLISYDASMKGYLKALEWMLGQRGLTGIGTTKVFEITELSSVAKKVGAEAIIILNLAQLKKLVGDPKPTLNAWAGSRINTEIPSFVLDHPSSIYGRNDGQFIMGKHMDKIAKARVPADKFDFHFAGTPDKLREFRAAAKTAYISGIDIETMQWSKAKKPLHDPDTKQIDGLGETWITIISFTFVDKDLKLSNWVVPFTNAYHDYWPKDKDYALALTVVKEACENDSIKLLHNGLYDLYHLTRYRMFVNNWQLDSMGFQHSMYSELAKDLSFVSSLWNHDHYHWKWLADAEHKAKNGDFMSYCEYGARDTWAMTKAMLVMIKEAKNYAFTNYSMAFPLVYPALFGAFEGLKINNKTRLRLLNEAQTRLANNKHKLTVMAADPEFNPSSPQQVSTFLYDVLGASKPPRAKSASASDATSRKIISLQHPLIAMFCDTINEYAKDAKAISTYFGFLQWSERMLWSLDPFGTDTGRFASRSSAAWIGTQIQNQPYYAKEMYEPDEGYLLFELDYSKAEAMCTAYLSQCLPLIKALTEPDLDKEGNPKDFYKVLGELFFSMQYEDVTTFFRNKVLKKIQHGTNYMMGAQTFIDNLDSITILYEAAESLGYVLVNNPTKPKEKTPKQFATDLLESYHVPFPEVRRWWQGLKDEVASSGQIRSPDGHVRVFFGDANKNHSVWRSAVAHQPQHTSVSNLNGGFMRAYGLMTALKDPSVLRIKTQIHDSILGQVKIEYAAELIPMLMDLVKATQVIHGRTMVINVDAEVSLTNWKEKIEWETFLANTLPTLGVQKSLTSIIDGSFYQS